MSGGASASIQRGDTLPLRVLPLVIGFPIVALMGEWVLTSTHHRPLGAVTFGALALGIFVGVQMLTRRVLVADTSRRRATLRLVVWAVGGAASAFALARSVL